MTSPLPTAALLEAARREHEAALDALFDFEADSVALLSSAAMRDRGELVKARVKKATLDREEALIGHITALVLRHGEKDRRWKAAAERRLTTAEGRLGELARWAWDGTITVSAVTIPPPGHDDPEEMHP